MDGYEILHPIGSGSFGKVFRARHKPSNKIVALKKISKGGRQEREITGLRQECEIQKNLHHPNIIQMLDSFETDDSVVVVTECAREDLCRMLTSGGCLSMHRVQTIACHLVSALYFLHSHRILHRDIKPQNILIGFDEMAKLCDFGFARTMGINTYMLTSIKGTPLYMAPEIIEEKPYDHNADLWSLGCILYELLVGTPPFFTTSLMQLMKKIKNPVHWPDYIVGDCLSFLQGLLEKNPQKRLTWPILLNHPFVRDNLYIDKTVKEFALTKALSPSQELAKEKQRQNLQKKLAGYSKLLAKTAKKLEDAQNQLKRCSEGGRPVIKTPMSSPNGLMVTRPCGDTLPFKPCAVGVPPQHPLRISRSLQSPMSEVKNLKVMFQNLKVRGEQEQDVRWRGVDDPEGNSGTSSCETMTSSSEFDTGSDDPSDEADNDTNTVIMDNRKRREGKKKYPCNSKGDQPKALDFLNTDQPEKAGSRGGSGLLWKSGALFTLHSFGSEDKPINSDEWIYFLINTMKEVLDNPKTLCEKHFLTMLVAPLRNHLSDPEVVEKITVLLSLPYTLDKSTYDAEPKLLSSLQSLYLDTKVLPNLIYACKLIVRRRRVEHGSATLEEISSILTVEDLSALEKCLRLVVYLVHMDEDFVTQLCDSVCVLQAFAILQLFLKLDGVRSGLAADTVAILCHILRTIPANRSIVEEILLDESGTNSTEVHAELWRLITHSNPAVQSRSLRVFTYLCVSSERVKTDFLVCHRSKIWTILHRATRSSNREVKEAGEFAFQSLLPKGTGKSNSTTSNSGHRNQTGSIPSGSNEIQEGSVKKNESLKVESTNEQQSQGPSAHEQTSVIVKEEESHDDTENSR